MSNTTKPSEWAKRKMEEAADGETAYHYHQMMEHWESKGM